MGCCCSKDSKDQADDPSVEFDKNGARIKPGKDGKRTEGNNDRPKPPKKVTKPKRYKVLHDYKKKNDGDLTIYKGDVVELLDNSQGDWWSVKNVSRGRRGQGYVPFNWLAEENSVQAQPWFFDHTTRSEAERLLANKGNQAGSFLVRNAEHPNRPKDEYSLSLLPGGRHKPIRHYKVQRTAQGQVFITNGEPFADLQTLVLHYQNNNLRDVMLKHPCIQTRKPVLPGLGAGQWEIEKDTLERVKALGSGQFGEVWHGLWNNTTDVAVKEMKGDAMEKEEFIQEAEIMKKMRHPNLIKLLAVSTRKDPIYIVTELMDEGALHHFLRKKKKGNEKLKVEKLVHMGTQIAHGMAYLEAKNFIHRDLAARNVLVNKDMVCKVADFGLARPEKQDEAAPTNNKFPVKWTAPEAFNGNFSIKSDIWSFGILLTEIMTHGEMPYKDVSNNQIYKKLTQENYRMPNESMPDCPTQLYDIMMECWHLNPQKRPAFFSLHDQLDTFFTNTITYVDY